MRRKQARSINGWRRGSQALRDDGREAPAPVVVAAVGSNMAACKGVLVLRRLPGWGESRYGGLPCDEEGCFLRNGKGGVLLKKSLAQLDVVLSY